LKLRQAQQDQAREKAGSAWQDVACTSLLYAGPQAAPKTSS